MPNAVNVRFTSLTRPDIEEIIGSIMARSFNSPASGQDEPDEPDEQSDVPVRLTWPQEIERRLAEMRAFGKSVAWPPGVSVEAAWGLQEFVDVRVKEYEEGIKKGVRLITSLNSFVNRQPGALDVLECAELLDCYLSAKAVNMIRLLLAFRLVNSPEPDWMRQFHHLPTVWDMQIIYGLPYVIHRRLHDDVLYWIDVDALAPNHRRTFRLHVPATVTFKFYHAFVRPSSQTLGSVECRASVLKRSEFVRYVAPQMVEQAVAQQATRDDLVAWASAPQQWHIIERAERIFETNNFGYWHDYKGDKEAARQDVLERLERKIEAREFGPWNGKFLSIDLSGRVERQLR